MRRASRLARGQSVDSAKCPFEDPRIRGNWKTPSLRLVGLVQPPQGYDGCNERGAKDTGRFRPKSLESDFERDRQRVCTVDSPTWYKPARTLASDRKDHHPVAERESGS